MRPAEAIRVPPPVIAPVMAHGFDRDVAASPKSTPWPLGEILVPADIRLDARAGKKRDALEFLADLLAKRTRATPGAVLAALLRRERLGPTYVGAGMAMPHGRLDGAPQPAAAVLRLQQPVDYRTTDGDMADLLVAVLWPDADPLDFVPTLARIWRLLRTPSAGKAIRQARTPEGLHSVFAGAGDRGR